MQMAGVPISDILSAPSALSSPRGPTGQNLFRVPGLLTNTGSDAWKLYSKRKSVGRLYSLAQLAGIQQAQL